MFMFIIHPGKFAQYKIFVYFSLLSTNCFVFSVHFMTNIHSFIISAVVLQVLDYTECKTLHNKTTLR